jgi:protein-disulfide isomerase
MWLRLFALALTVGIVGLLPPAAVAQDDQSLTPKQQDAVRKLVHDYIMENPAIVAEAIDALREKEALAAENAGKKALRERHEEIVNDPDSPVLGTPKGDIALVEFFDYRCVHCKAMTDMIFDVAQDKKVRLVMKEWPILGADSIFAAKASLAARAQGPKLYEDFHRAMMHWKDPLTKEAVLRLATSVKLDRKKLEKDMEDPRLDEIIKKNQRLARALDLAEPPAFVIGDSLVTGVMTKESLGQLIDQTRKPKG